ncbi:hypothetical protein JCM18899A_53160 [Nocardioides sp. AN3]
MSGRRGSLRRSLIARVAIGTLLAAAVVILSGGPALAHAELEGSDPAPGAVLATPPIVVSLRFSERVTTSAGAVRVFAPDGRRVDSGRVRVDGRWVRADFDGSPRGTYLVSWRVVSDDSHPVSGVFTFSVGAPSAAPAAPGENADRGLQVGLGVARWVGYLGAAVLVGGVAFLCWCWPDGWRSRRAPLLTLAGAGAVLLACAVSLLLKGPFDAGLGWSALGRGELVREVLDTTYGRATLSRGLLALLLGLLVVGRGGLSVRELGAYGGLLGVCIAVSFALSGHAVAGDLHRLALASETVHVLAMCLWLGGLVMLVGGAVWRTPGARTVLLRFSAVAMGSAIALVVTGLFQTWRQVRSVSALGPTTYGRELLVKVALVVLVLAVATGTRRLLGREGPLASLRRSVAVEAVLVLAILAVTSGLVATEPARSAYHRDAGPGSAPPAR